MATQGCSQGEGSDDGSVSLIPAPLPATPSNTIRNKEASKKVIKMNMVNVLPKYVKARPLNSWMAFRSFYCGLFNGVQQKHASTHLNVLWQQDPFKAKWAVVAKTYTMIKDRVGKQMAPLHAFLRLTCPKMGIIDVSDYLEQLNWTVTYENGDLTITQVGQPNLATFDRAIICCSMNHIDLLQYVLDNGYLNEVDGFTHDIRYNNTHMLVSAATMSQDEAQEAFSNAIRNGPKAIAAQIFGLDVNHKFLEISSSPSAEALNYPIQLPVVGNTMQSAAQLPIPQQPMQMMGPYPWTGSMSELYKPSEIELDFEAIMAMDEWMVTDISNPVDMDNFLETAGGYNPNELFPGLLAEPTLMYNFSDSF